MTLKGSKAGCQSIRLEGRIWLWKLVINSRLFNSILDLNNDYKKDLFREHDGHQNKKITKQIPLFAIILFGVKFQQTLFIYWFARELNIATTCRNMKLAHFKLFNNLHTPIYKTRQIWSIYTVKKCLTHVKIEISI